MIFRTYFTCEIFNLILCFSGCVLCVGGANIPEHNCSEGCVGLEQSSENTTENTGSNSDYENWSDGLVDVFNTTNVELLRFATPCETPNHEPTYCVEIAECPVLSAVANKKKYADFIEASKCGPANENKKNIKVCCGKYNSFRNVSKQIESTTIAPSITKENKIFPKKCGTQRHIFRPRIIGGTEAVLGEYPWLARIIHKNNYGYKSYGCAGFLIHTKYIVSAAHCINSEFAQLRGDPYSVVLGEHNTETKIDCSPGGTYCAEAPQVSRISQIIVHPSYDNKSKNHHNDIALIYLKKAVKLTEFVQPICLLADANQEVKKYFISGWGKTESRESSAIKLKVDLEPFDAEECKNKFQMLNLEINESQICAGGTKLKDSCNGDSGGPLMMAPNASIHFAAGLVSYGIGCGMEGWPGVYTSIPTYVPWIETEILKLSVSDRLNKIKNPKKKKNKKRKGAEQVTVENVPNNT